MRILPVLRASLLALTLLFGGAVASTLAPGTALAQQSGTAPKDGGARDSGRNPTAESVHEEDLFRQSPRIRGIVSIPDEKSATLEQPQGRVWRGFREAYLPWIGGAAVLGTVALLGIFYMIVGRIGRDDRFSGETILRFNWFERFSHWMTASCFIVLAISGLNYIFGKRLLMPLIGPDAFSALSQWGKYAHNFLSFPFMLGVLFMFALWVRDNIPNRIDWAWIKQGGGFFGGHPHAERFNAGQKGVFWIVVLGGALMSATGITLLFPFAWLDIDGMQWAEGVHALIGVGFIAAILAHIYIGTLGMKGAYDAMGTGEVDVAWAKSHHDLWVQREQAKDTGAARRPPASVPAE